MDESAAFLKHETDIGESHGGSHGGHHGGLDRVDLPAADLDSGIALASSWQAAGEVWQSLTSRGQADVAALIHWGVKHLPALAGGTELNRVIPGQQSYNRWAIPKGLTVVVCGSRSASRHAILHAVAAAMCGNPVHVLACGAAAAKAWNSIVDGVEHGGRIHVSEIASRHELLSQLAGPEIATVILDGSADEWAALLDAMVQTPPGARHLRALHCPGAWPPPDRPDALLRAHLHVTSLAVNTMRHGAALEVAAAG